MAEEPSAVNIKLKKRHIQVFEDFLKLAADGDMSRAALDLTEKVIEISPSNYHAWCYRWECLEASGSLESFQAEQDFVKKLAENNCKNYQLWNHRRCLAFKLGLEKAVEELEFAAECLEEDHKNYHTWAHRQAVVRQFDLWDLELEYTEVMIGKDVRNNSAWNQRFFVWTEGSWPERPKWVDEELEFVSEAIMRAPHNESSWNYLRGLCECKQEEQLLARSPKIHSLVQMCLAKTPSCSPALSLLASIYLAQMEVSLINQNQEASAVLADLARQCFERLKITDPIRQLYWAFRANSVGSQQ